MTISRHITIGRVASAMLLAVAGLVFADSSAWRDARFPGFFVMPNRVVPSVALPGWAGVADGRPLYQQVVLEVDGSAPADGGDVYRLAARRRPGDGVDFTVSRAGDVEHRTVPVRTLGSGEWVAIFGMYLLCGLCYLALAVLATERRRTDRALAGGLAALGWIGAAFMLTAIDLYGPGRFFRLHALAEALLPAATLHLALVCPRDRVAGRPGLLPAVYGSALALAAVHQVFLYDPAAYTVLHDLCQTLAALPIFALAAMLGATLAEPPPSLGALGARWLLGGTLVGCVAPGIVLALSGASGGQVPVNASAWIGFAFPIAAAIALQAGTRPRVATVPAPQPAAL
jgi:hypothetical protein